MIVEMIGCSGAGKTTLARLLAHRGIGGRPAVVMADLALDRPGLRRIRHPTARNVVQEVACLPSFATAVRRQPEFRTFLGRSCRLVAAHGTSAAESALSMRSIMRRTGMYHLARQRAGGRVVIADEGPVLSAYHVFVYSTAPRGPAELEEFARWVPLPDRIVYVRSPVESLVRRAASRPERRRQLDPDDPAETTHLLQRAADVFDALIETRPLRDRVIVVENDDRDDGDLERLAHEIAGRLVATTSDLHPSAAIR